MKTLQIKYCYTEEDANQFLKKFDLGNDVVYPRLQSIQYCNKVNGDAVDLAEATVDGITGHGFVNSDIIAIIQYVDEVQ